MRTKQTQRSVTRTQITVARNVSPVCEPRSGCRRPRRVATQVGSRTGAPALGFGGFPMAFAIALSPTPIATFPVPAASNRTCGSPASGFPTNVTSRHTPQGLHLVVKLLPMHTSLTAGGNRLTPLSNPLHFRSMSEVRPLPSTGVTRLPRYYAPVRHLIQPSLALAGYRLEALAASTG